MAENVNKDLLGYAIYGPEPQADATYQVYNVVHSPLIKNGGILSELLQYIESDLLKNKVRILVFEISSHDRYKSQYEAFLKQNYNVSSIVSNFYSEGEDKLILAKNLSL